MNWYNIYNIENIDSPALVLYKERIQQNINLAVEMVKDVSKLRPHVKTNKITEVCAMMMEAGISKFKCATIAEAEMLAMIKAKDVLLAYQPVGPKIKRLLRLIQQYKKTEFSCLVDNFSTAKSLSEVFFESGTVIEVFIDLNIGMNRTGIQPKYALDLFKQLQQIEGIRVKGLHAYDGQIRDTDIIQRQKKSDIAFKSVADLAAQIESITKQPITIVAGGTPTFPTHIKRKVECSPGTFVFCDWGYKHQLPDEPFGYAALVITRVISIVDDKTITTDLGHKSVAAENPLPRVHFLNAADVTPVGQSEEHLVLKVTDSSTYKIGDVLYGVPVHICPTVALYEKAQVIENNEATTTWNVIGRDRAIII